MKLQRESLVYAIIIKDQQSNRQREMRVDIEYEMDENYSDHSIEKEKLRKQFFKQSKEFRASEENVNAANAKLADKVREQLAKFSENKINSMAYVPFKSEAPILNILEPLDVNVYVPKVEGQNMLVEGLDSKMILSPEELDLVIVPALYIGKDGSRLGRGGGHYDRFLHQIPLKRRWFVGYSWQIVSRLPTEPWDQNIGRWISEHGSELCSAR